MGAQTEAGMRSLRRRITGEKVSNEGVDEIAFLGDKARAKRHDTLGQQSDERLGEANVSHADFGTPRGAKAASVMARASLSE